MQMKRTEPNMSADPRKQQLLEDLQKVIDPDLIDCSIYELKAVQMRYQFLLKQAELLDLTI